MRIKGIGFCIAVILILTFSCIMFTIAASSKFAAKVNGVGIKNATLDAAVTNFIENQKARGVDVKEEDKEGLRKGILEELIAAELLYQKSKKADLGDLKETIEQQFENIKKGFASEEDFKKVLKDRGISQKDLKQDIKKGVYISEFLDKEVYASIAIAEEEKRQEYERRKDMLDVPEQIKASHILIRVAPDASDEEKVDARARIGELRKRAVSGEDFAGLARENSEDGSAPRGGDLGYFSRGQMVKPFEDAAFSLEGEAISKVVETQFGYHIIKLVDRQAARKLSYAEVEKPIATFLLDRRKREAVDRLVEDLRQKAKIERY